MLAYLSVEWMAPGLRTTCDQKCTREVKCRNGHVLACKWGKSARSPLNRAVMQAIKAVLVGSLVVIGIIPIDLLAAAEVAEHPTRGAS